MEDQRTTVDIDELGRGERVDQQLFHPTVSEQPELELPAGPGQRSGCVNAQQLFLLAGTAGGPRERIAELAIA